MAADTDQKICPQCEKRFAKDLVVCPEDRTMLMARSEEDTLVGMVLNERYQVVEVLHKGHSSTICRANHVLMDRTVAVKFLSPRLINDQLSVMRFQQEAQAASHLSHPGTVEVYDYGFIGTGQPYLVMNYYHGTNIDTIVKKEGPLVASRFCNLFRLIIHSLSYCHKKGVHHRDLKPSHFHITTYHSENDITKENLFGLNDGDELPIIVDFRSAKLMLSSGKQAQSLTQPGETIGTPLYMSVEQAKGEKTDERSEVYSLGCSMYYALTGEPPFTGDSPLEIYQKHLNEKIDLSRLPDELAPIVSKALEKEPSNRYQTMSEFYDAITAKEINV